MTRLYRNKVYFIIGSLVTLLLLLFYYLHAMDEKVYIEQGKLDLSTTDFASKGVIPLNGEWEFYWNELLTPSDFNHTSQKHFNYQSVPGNWLQDKDGNTYANRGYATYRIVITNIQKYKYFGIKKGNIRNSSKIFVNGDLILKDGEPTKKIKESIPGNDSEVVYFELNDAEAEIIIQVTNYEYLVGGIAKPIILGKQKDLMLDQYQSILFEFAMIVIVVIIGLFYLFLFLVSKDYRKKEPVTLPLALSCLFFGVMNSIYSERILTILFPELPLNLIFRFGHLMNGLSVIMVVIVVNKVKQEYLSKRIRNSLIIFFSTFMVFVLVLPLELYLKTLTFYMVSAILIFFLLWLRIFIMYFKNKENTNETIEHAMLIVSVFSIFLFWFDMILYSLGLKVDMFISFLMICTYSIALATLLIVRYTKSYKRNEELSIELIETFSTLDQTAKKAQRNELAFLQAQIKPHFLFNALSSIISLCYTDGKRAGVLLSQLSNYLKRSFQIDIHTDFVTLENELKLIRAYVDIEKVRFGDRIAVTYDVDVDILSFKIIPLVIEPLVENAIRHGVLKNKSGGEVRLTLKRYGTGNSVYIGVEDNGKGIDAHQLNTIQEGERNGQSMTGNGISLANINARLRSVYQVELQFETDQKGTKVYFIIPLNLKKEEATDD